MGEHQIIVRQGDAKHRSGEHHSDGALNRDRFFRIHDVDACRAVALPPVRLGTNVDRSGEQRGAQLSAGCAIIPGLPAIATRKGTLRAVRTRPFFTRARFIYVQRPAI